MSSSERACAERAGHRRRWFPAVVVVATATVIGLLLMLVWKPCCPPERRSVCALLLDLDATPDVVEYAISRDAEQWESECQGRTLLASFISQRPAATACRTVAIAASDEGLNPVEAERRQTETWALFGRQVRDMVACATQSGDPSKGEGRRDQVAQAALREVGASIAGFDGARTVLVVADLDAISPSRSQLLKTGTGDVPSLQGTTVIVTALRPDAGMRALRF